MLQFDTDSTISAIATGEAPGIRGAIRITGPDTMAILTKVCAAVPECRRATRWETTIQGPTLGTIPVSVYAWPDQRSYTGQPSAELHAFGAPVILRQLQQRVMSAGAKLAQPGEFTLRAFLAGRLDLTQCEAVLGVIHANNEKALQVALNQLAGGLTQPLNETRRDLINLLADIEAGLDFVDEDISFISSSQILDRLQSAKTQIETLLHQMQSRSGQTVAYQIALVGEPNAGKSSLLNALAENRVAIVSPTPGTTRDFLRFRMQVDGLTVDLLDTAGLENWNDESPRGLAQTFTREQIEQADLILHCIDTQNVDSQNVESPSVDSESVGKTDAPHYLLSSKQIKELAADKPVWTIRTKSDLTNCASQDLLDENEIRFGSTYKVSALTGEGIEHLKNAIVEWIKHERESQADAVPMTVERCRGSLSNALIAVEAAMKSTRHESGDEITAGELRIALDEIGLVTGTIYNDDILDALFSRFCIGK